LELSVSSVHPVRPVFFPCLTGVNRYSDSEAFVAMNVRALCYAGRMLNQIIGD